MRTAIRKEHIANGDPLPPVVRPGPANPLGEFKMRLAVRPEQLLDRALGKTTAAIDWDYANDALKLADGIPVMVGLEADRDSEPATASAHWPAAGGGFRPSAAR